MRRGQKLGQHFLRSQKALNKIIEAAELTPSDTVLEIGPGEGALTEKLLEQAGHVLAVEKDPELVQIMREKFEKELSSGHLALIENDVRNLDLARYKLHATGYKLVANIPYYITGELLRAFLSTEMQPERIVFLVQKEVAERVARSKKESILSLSIKVFGNPQYIATVPKGAFSPPPSVDSAILLISHISRKKLENIDENRFFELVKAGFSSKRKFLKGNLKKIAPEVEILSTFEHIGLDEKVRAENVSLEEWLQMAQFLSQ